MPNWFWVALVAIVVGYAVYLAFVVRRARRIRDAALAHKGAVIGEPLVNPFEVPETDERRIARKLRQGECPDCENKRFYEQGAMKGPDDATEKSVIKFVQCTNCMHSFRIRYIDHPLNPIEARRYEQESANPQ